MNQNFATFTQKYQLSKTLRFELKPIGKDGKVMTEEASNQLFENILIQDRKINDAYNKQKDAVYSSYRITIFEL
jgi:CRISPR-associated protein Cpf1